MTTVPSEVSPVSRSFPPTSGASAWTSFIADGADAKSWASLTADDPSVVMATWCRLKSSARTEIGLGVEMIAAEACGHTCALAAQVAMDFCDGSPGTDAERELLFSTCAVPLLFGGPRLQRSLEEPRREYIVCRSLSAPTRIVMTVERADRPHPAEFELLPSAIEAAMPTMVEEIWLAPVESRHAYRETVGRSGVSSDSASRSAIRWSAFLIGLARAALEAAVSYAQVREQFGRPLGANQALAFTLARNHSELVAARARLLELALAPALGTRLVDVDEVSAAAADSAVAVAETAVHVHGALGLTEGTEVARYLRHAYVIAGATATQETWVRAAKGEVEDGRAVARERRPEGTDDAFRVRTQMD